MFKKQSEPSTSRSGVPTLDQVSAGGVVFRRRDSCPELVIVLAKPKLRWQLPKGLIDPGESPEDTAVREVREEAGVEAELLELIETIEFWYRSLRRGKPVRYHKHVHFYLMKYHNGDVSDHDHEVEEARWVSFEEAAKLLAFKSERGVGEKAREMIAALERGDN